MLAYGTVKDVQSVLAPEGSLSRQGLGGTEGSENPEKSIGTENLGIISTAYVHLTS